jgi:hypothetical protein
LWVVCALAACCLGAIEGLLNKIIIYESDIFVLRKNKDMQTLRLDGRVSESFNVPKKTLCPPKKRLEIWCFFVDEFKRKNTVNQQ